MTTKPSAIASFVIRWHKPLDRIPAVSTAVNLVYLFQKLVFNSTAFHDPRAFGYPEYLGVKSYFRCVVLSAPVLLALSMPVVALSLSAVGNVVIALVDRKAKQDLIAEIRGKGFSPLRFARARLEIRYGDRDVALATVCTNPYHFPIISETHRKDQEILNGAILSAIEYLSSLREDPEVTVGILSGAYNKFAPELRTAPDVIRKATRVGVKVNLQPLGAVIQADEGLVTGIVSRDGLQLQWASAELLNNQNVVLAAVRNNPEAFRMAYESLQRNAMFKQMAYEANHRILEVPGLSRDPDLVQASQKFSWDERAGCNHRNFVQKGQNPHITTAEQTLLYKGGGSWLDIKIVKSVHDDGTYSFGFEVDRRPVPLSRVVFSNVSAHSVTIEHTHWLCIFGFSSSSGDHEVFVDLRQPKGDYAVVSKQMKERMVAQEPQVEAGTALPGAAAAATAATAAAAAASSTIHQKGDL